MTGSERLIGPREAARRLGVHENTIRNWAKSGLLKPDGRVGYAHYMRFRPAEVERLRRAHALGKQAAGAIEQEIGEIRAMTERAVREVLRAADEEVRRIRARADQEIRQVLRAPRE